MSKTPLEAMAIAEAEFDGRPWLAMPRIDRDRYLTRAKRSLRALRKNVSEEMVEAAYEEIEIPDGSEPFGWFRTSLRKTIDAALLAAEQGADDEKG